MIRFDVHGQTCVLGRQDADDLAAALRVLAINGGAGSKGALAFSYVLEDALIDDNVTRIPLNGLAAEAVYRVLNHETSDPPGVTRYAVLLGAVVDRLAARTEPLGRRPRHRRLTQRLRFVPPREPGPL